MTNGILDSGKKIITNGLVINYDIAQLRSYPKTGTVITDLSGNNNNGTLINGILYNTSNGGILSLDGTNDYIETLSNPIANNTSFSIETWIKFPNFNASTFKPIIDCGNFGGGTGYTLAKNNSNKLYIAIDSGYVSISNVILNNTWYHIVATADKTTNYQMYIYLNNVLGTQNGSAIASSLTNSRTKIRLSYNFIESTTYFASNISEVKIYNKALSATEISQNFNANRSRYGL